MDHTMHLPASYAVLSEDEMTYLDGGKEIVLASFGNKSLVLDTDEFNQFLVSVAVNFGVMMTAASFSFLSNTWQSGKNNGLSPSGTVHHTWDKLATPWSRFAAIGIVGLAGVYAGMKAIDAVRTIKGVYDSVVSALPQLSASAA